MPVIFISYRREDSAGHAGRLFDRLREHFGKESVFLDVVGIEAGVDFVDTLDRVLGSCDVLLAVIGRDWLSCCDKQGRRRLDEPNDFIRAEISAALKRDVRVVPILVQGAEMPPTDDLPEELARLTRRQAVELRDSRWDDDVEALIAALETKAKTAPASLPAPAPPPPVHTEFAGVEAAGPRPRRPALFWGIGALVAVLLAVGAIRFFSRSENAVPQTDPLQEPGQSVDPVQSPEPVPPPEAKPSRPAPERKIKLPDLVGLDVERAKKTLDDLGLYISRSEHPSPKPEGTVLSQNPLAGARVAKGTRVHLLCAVPIKDDMAAMAGEYDLPENPKAPLPVGGSVSRPERISSVSIQYPEKARKARITGTVIIRAIIDEQGNVASTEVLKGLPLGLDRAAEESVRQWKFTPAMQNGKPVKVYYVVTVECRLK
jgi:TonB family protein